MIKTICDLCKIELEWSSHPALGDADRCEFYVRVQKVREGNPSHGYERHADLCPACAEKVYKALKNVGLAPRKKPCEF